MRKFTNMCIFLRLLHTVSYRGEINLHRGFECSIKKKVTALPSTSQGNKSRKNGNERDIKNPSAR